MDNPNGTAKKEKRPLHPRNKPCPRCSAAPGDPCKTRKGIVHELIHCTERITGSPVDDADKYPYPTISIESGASKKEPEISKGITGTTTGASNKSIPEQHVPVMARSRVETPPENPAASTTPPQTTDAPQKGTGVPNKSSASGLDAVPEELTRTTEPADLAADTSNEEPTTKVKTFDDEAHLFNPPKKPKTEKSNRGTRKNEKTGSNGSKPQVKPPVDQPSFF